MTASDDNPRVVDCVVVDGIATITLDSQHNRNALSRQLLADLHRALDEAETVDARAIVLTHRGPAFCAGADLKDALLREVRLPTPRRSSARWND